jgi:hypothetical protein
MPRDAMKTILINSESLPIKTRHISFYVRKTGDNLELFEVEDCFFPHPDAPDDAFVQRIETRLVKEARIETKEAAPLFLLWNAQENVRLSLIKEDD